MAAWGSILNIFENPLPIDSLSSWSQLLPKSVDTVSATTSFDMFVRAPHSDKWNTTMSEPDDNAFEIFGELFYKSNPEDVIASKPPPSPTDDLEIGKNRVVPYYRRSYSDVRPRSRDGGLMIPPPPITSIGKGGKPRVYFKSYRKDGRFVLREIRIPTQQLLHSTRENGRLTMRVADHDPDINSGEEEEE